MLDTTEPEPLPESLRIDYAGRCWWCGGDADSREHKYKKTDFLREFGAGPWSDGDRPVRWSGDVGREQDVRGAKSTLLKFGLTLCTRCNNVRSQPFDNAYDLMAEYLAVNERQTSEQGVFDLRVIYGKRWRESRDNALRYFVKHIGCQMATGRIPIPDGLIAFLDGASPRPQGLALELTIRGDILALEEHEAKHGNTNFGALWIGKCWAEYSRSQHTVTDFIGHYGFGATRATYVIKYQDSRYRSNLQKRRVRIRTESNIDPATFQQSCDECSPLMEGSN